MAKSIEIKSPIVGAILLIGLLFVVWFLFGPFRVGGKSLWGLNGYFMSIMYTLIVLYGYYSSFLKKK